ncbi:MAG: hypothetical protein AB2794_06940 [Candidatus Thiodiazotropha endolucinida]
MVTIVEFTLSYGGGIADSRLVDMYDVSQALIGFQRSIALTTHLIINEQIITQAPALKGASVLALPAEEGSWKFTAIVIAGLTGVYQLGTAPNNTPLGHLIFSAYDYVVKESLGFHVDYNTSLGQLYEENKEKEAEVPMIKEHQVDSLIEKCNTAITEIHRPIFKTKSASNANIEGNWGQGGSIVGGPMSIETYKYIHEVFIAEEPEIIAGRVSSYNSNTFKGRIYVAKEGRPVAFELSENCRVNNSVQLIVASLSVNAVKDYDSEWSTVFCKVFRNTSRSGHLKSYSIIEVSHIPISEE